MKTPTILTLCGLALFTLTLTSCVVDPLVVPPPPHAFLPPPPLLMLPVGARVYHYHGERCWHHNGHYYRRNPHGRGFVTFRP